MTEQSVTKAAGNDNGEIVVVRLYEKFVDGLKRRAEVDSANRGFDIASKQIDAILAAETEADFWDADISGTVNGQDMMDIEMMVRAVTFAESSDEYDAPLGVYAIVDATRLDNGEECIISTGAPLVVAKLRAAEARDMFPLGCVIKGTKAGKGTVLKLRPLPVRVTPGVPVEK